MGNLVTLLVIAPVKLSAWFIYWIFTGKEALGWIRFTERAEYDLSGEDDEWLKSIHRRLKKINDKRRY